MKTKERLFAAITVVLSAALALLAAEWVLRQQDAQIVGSDAMEPGMLRYDGDLGWRLTPAWRGTHRHYDYEVEYSIDLDGFRDTPAVAGKDPGGKMVAWLGDSFTFGLGVNDSETFINRINEAQKDVLHRNYALPGYSTDQEMLLQSRYVLPNRPDKIVLVTYLGNDIYDNTLDYPLQAAQGKPRFELADGRLRRVSGRVSTQPSPLATRSITLTTMVNGDARAEGLMGFLSQFALARRLGVRPSADGAFDQAFRARQAEGVALYGALVRQMQTDAGERSIPFTVVLLPGRSAVHSPNSPSGRAQRLLAEMIRAELAQEVRVLEVLPALQAAGSGLFHPNEGHLTRKGHQVVADWIGQQNF